MEEVVRLAEKHLGSIPASTSKKKRLKFTGYKPKTVVLQKTVKQSRVALGRPAYSFSDENRVRFICLQAS